MCGSGGTMWARLALLLCSCAALTSAAVTIPPLLVTQPAKEEILFTVTHDPDQPSEPFTLPCRADGLPASSYSWLKDGEPFDLHDDEEEVDRVEMVEGEGTLVFHDPRPEDEGNYQCIADNTVGVVYSEVATVRRTMMGYFPAKKEPRVITATLGQSLALPCDPPEGYPEPSVHWVLQTSDGGLRSLNTARLMVDEEGTLWFSHITPDDASDDALYACAASTATSGQEMFLVEDEEGQLQMVEDLPHNGPTVSIITLPSEYRMGNWVYLNVSYPGGDKTATVPENNLPPVQQYISQQEITALEGDHVELYCVFGGYPVPEVRWWREERVDTESEELGGEVDHYGKVLVLQELEGSHAGTYYCQAGNDAGESDIQRFTISVEAAPEFAIEPESINQTEGETAVFNCEASGDPLPTITWTKDGQPLESHETTLVFDKLAIHQKAVIACNASNDHGYVYKSVYLNVASLPPEWMTEPEDVAVLEGEAATLHCEAYGSPDPNITWSRVEDEEEVDIHDEDPRYDIDETRMIIKSVDVNTAGRYICTATNKFDSIDSEASVAMRVKTSVEAAASSDRVEAGQHVSFQCHVRMDPELDHTLTWLKDDEQIQADNQHYVITRQDDSETADEDANDDNDESEHEDEDEHEDEAGVVKEVTWVLEIMGARGHDSGVYTCSVNTDLDDAREDLILIVEDVPNPPHLMDSRCLGREVLLKWASAGDNNSPVLGYVIQYTSQFQDQWKDAENKIPASTNSFTVDMSPGMNYTYRVLAVNKVGMSEPSEDIVECASPGLAPDHHPHDLSVQGHSPGALLVSWTAMDYEEHNGPDFHYKVYWRPVGDKEDEEAAVEDVTETEVDDDEDDEGWHSMVIEDWETDEVEIQGLPPYHQYEVKVEAANAYGPAEEAEEATIIRVESGQDVPESPPEDAKFIDVDARDAVLTWTPVSEESVRGLLLGYKVEYWLDKDGDEDEDDDESPEEVLVTGPARRAELIGLQPYTSYKARVSAVNSAFTGPTGHTLSFTTAEGESGPVTNLKAKQMGNSSILLTWSEPEEPHGTVRGYEVQYCTVSQDGEDEGPLQHYHDRLDPTQPMVKLFNLQAGGNYRVTVAAVNAAGQGEGSSIDVDLETSEPIVPIVPLFSMSVLAEEEVEEKGTDRDGDGDVDDQDARNKYVIIGDTDGDGDVDEDDVLDTDNDGDIDEHDIDVADINNDGVVNEADVAAADRDGDGDVDISDIGDEDGDGDFDGADVLAADEDGDGDIDAADDDEESTLLEDRDQDGDIDRDDVTDINHDGIVDEKDFNAADVDGDGDVDYDDVKMADKDGDGDIDAADITDLDGDGRIDGDDLEVTDRDGDGDIDRRDFELKGVFLADTDGDGDVDDDDVLDLDGDGDIDSDDIQIADIDNDGDVDADDVLAADRDKDGDIDFADIGDEDNDGDIDAQDLLAADEDGDGDIDRSDDDEENTLLEDRDGDGDFDRDDVVDLDGDGDVDMKDFAAADVDDDGDIDQDDIKALDRDGDGDVDAADITDLDGDGKVDGDDIEVNDRDADGDIDIKDFVFRNTLLADTDGDGDIDQNDVLDVDGDGDIDEADFNAADIDDDGDVDLDDVKFADKDGDNDVDASDIDDVNNDGIIDEEDLDTKDRDGDGDVDARDFALREVFLADTNKDGRIDREDVLDTDGDGDIDQQDFEVADINNDGEVDVYDLHAGDRDQDGDIDVDDIGDEDGDGDVDGSDVIAADEDGDGDIDARDDDGESVLLVDTDGDQDFDRNDVRDLDGDNDIDEDDMKIADVNNDGLVNNDDVRAADMDGDGDVDAADIADATGDGVIDGHDLLAADKDGDGDVDMTDLQNLDVFLKDTDGDGDVDEDDVLDSDHDGDVDEADIRVADINNDGVVDRDDILAADQNDDGVVDFRDIGDIDGDGDIDGHDVVAADRNSDGAIDLGDEGRGVDVRIDWKPDFENHPGVDFYVQSRINGTKQWKNYPVEKSHLHQTISGLDPRRDYQVRIVARDGPFETPSKIQEIERTIEGPITGGSTTRDMEVPNPIIWTWFVIAVMVAVIMICIVFFSMWVYNQRLSRVSELRKELYRGYEPAEPEAIKQAEVDLEAAKPPMEDAVEDEMSANYQRKQLAAMMKRQETIQSVDSFASHDDDFAEYGDESMGRFNDDGSLIHQKV